MLLNLEMSGSAAGDFLSALRQHDPSIYEEVVYATTKRMAIHGESPDQALRQLPGAYGNELAKLRARISDQDAAEYIATMVALDRPLVDTNPKLCQARKAAEFDGDDHVSEELKDRMMRLAANSIRTAGDYPIASTHDLARWAIDVLDPKYAAHIAALNRFPIPDPEAQLARIACDKDLILWETMAQLPVQKRGAIFRATQQPQ